MWGYMWHTEILLDEANVALEAVRLNEGHQNLDFAMDWERVRLEAALQVERTESRYSHETCGDGLNGPTGAGSSGLLSFVPC